MSKKHTPGPWSLHRTLHEKSGSSSLVLAGDWVHGKFNGSVIASAGTNINAENDLRLIAAAPDLLEALRALTDHVSHYAAMPHAHSDAYKDVALAHAAITKAEGRS